MAPFRTRAARKVSRPRAPTPSAHCSADHGCQLRLSPFRCAIQRRGLVRRGGEQHRARLCCRSPGGHWRDTGHGWRSSRQFSGASRSNRRCRRGSFAHRFSSGCNSLLQQRGQTLAPRVAVFHDCEQKPVAASRRRRCGPDPPLGGCRPHFMIGAVPSCSGSLGNRRDAGLISL